MAFSRWARVVIGSVSTVLIRYGSAMIGDAAGRFWGSAVMASPSVGRHVGRRVYPKHPRFTVIAQSDRYDLDILINMTSQTAIGLGMLYASRARPADKLKPRTTPRYSCYPCQ